MTFQDTATRFEQSDAGTDDFKRLYKEAFEQMNRILVEEKVAFRLRDFAEHLNVIEVRTCSTDCVIDPARRYTVVKTIPTQKMRPPTHARIIRRQHK